MTAGQQASRGALSGSVLLGAGWRNRRAAFWSSVALLSAALAWWLHHTPFFAEHEILTALIAVLMASAAAVLIVGIAANRRHAPPPAVIVAGVEDVRVREASEEDIEFCASLHARALAHGFFVSLGPTFLRAYYESFLASPYARAHVATLKGHRAGMLVGLLRPRAHLRWLLRRRGPILAALGIGAMLTRPLLTLRFLHTRPRRYRRTWRRHRGAKVEGETASEAVLSHVAVLDGARGVGIGAELVGAFLDDAAGDGRQRVVLTTLAGERGARDFYLAHGWSETGRRVGADGEVSIVMGISVGR